MQHEPGMGPSQRLIFGVLWLEALSRTRCTARWAGIVGVDAFEKLEELNRAVALMQGADNLAGLDVQRGVEAGGAVALIVMGRALGGAGQHRQRRRGAVQRLDLAFLIDGQDDGALGRVEVQAADVVDLLDELRVGGELELSWRWGCSPNACQIRSTAFRVTPASRAIDRVDQCVASLGVLSSVLAMIASTCSSVIVRGRPGRGSSTSPSSRRSANRLRHFVTVGAETPSSSAISRLVNWPAAPSTIRARNASA